MQNKNNRNSFKHFLCAVFLFALIPSHLSYAGGEFSGGSIIKAFESMSPDEAYSSNKFRKRVWNIHMPGTSTWYKPSTSLCIEDNTVQTVQPQLHCSQWTVDLKSSEFGSDTKSFTSLHRAQKKADSKNGKGKPYCTAGVYKYIKAAIDNFELTYIAEFYKKVHGSEPYDNDYFLGEHEYPLLDCIFFERRPENNFSDGSIIKAGGEGAGGGSVKKDDI